ncbi:unnamed protein product [Merluccius merluccius]
MWYVGKTAPGAAAASLRLTAALRRLHAGARTAGAAAGTSSSRGSTDAAGRPEPHWTPPSSPRRRSRQQEQQRTSVDFEETREAYRSKDSLELLRSLVVFKLCSYDVLVDRNKEIMDLGKKVLGQRAFEQFMKMTFYGQFVAGEDHRAIRPLLQKNQAFGVGSVLDYSVEEDVDPEETQGDHPEESKAHARFGERRGGASEAASYLYADEAKCDRHVETFLKCIRASGGGAMEGFSAIKMTALGRPQFLLRLSEVLLKWRRFFTFLAAQQGNGDKEALEQKLELKLLQEFLTRLGAKGDLHGWFTDRMHHSSGTIDMLDWDSLIDNRANTSDLLLVPDVRIGALVPLLENFTAEDENQMKRILQRMDVLAKHAEEHGVSLMVDAEQTYLQPAISCLTLEMQKIYNRRKPLILNTYQCYLKEAYDNVTLDLERSRREGWCFGAKLVRGAYMHQERERAGEMGYEDPINPDYESTNRMYHRCLDHVLEEIALSRKANVMVASHNEDTVRHTLRRMNELGLAPTENRVSFGQLLGMCDQISFPLGQAGYPVYKYVPYGPVNEVMPYLSRRAQENRGFMKGAEHERQLLLRELKRRLASGEIFHRPVF